MNNAFNKYNVEVLQIGSNYFPAKIGNMDVRVCFACEEDHFDKFIERMYGVIE